MNQALSPPADATPAERGAIKIPALRMLSEIATSLSTDSNLDQLLERFLPTMVRLAGAHAGAVRILNAEGTHFRLVGSIGLPPDVVERERLIPVESGVCGETPDDTQCKTENGTHVCNETAALDYFGHRCKKVIAVPVRHKGRLLGIYNLFLERDAPIPEEVTLLFNSISEHLGLAMENTRLTQENLRISLMNERQMLANEVHDSLAQTLAYLKMRVELLRDMLVTGNADMVEKYICDVEDGIDGAYFGLRELINQFRHRMNPRGLLPALQELMDGFSLKTGIKVMFVNRARSVHLTPEQEVHVFHIVQEALANTYKHAEATHVHLCFEINEGNYLVTVTDDGIGVKRQKKDDDSLHFGISIMHERAQRLGGAVAVESEPGIGTRVQLAFPAKEQGDWKRTARA